MLIKETSLSWPGLPAALPSPASPSAVIVSPETLSRYSSSSPSRAHRPPQFALTLPCSSQPIPAVCYPATTYLEVTEDRNWKNLGADALATTLSALYGKLLVVMGIAFPMAEVISTYIPPSFYEAFYLYLYFGSMIFLLYMYATLLRDGKPKPKKQRDECDFDSSQSSSGGGGDSDVQETGCPHVTYARPAQHYGSFYLRMGAVAFGIGSMIYSGLEFGQYFELERDTKCHNVMLALTPATRMAFIFIQMYFIFLNNEQMKVYRHRVVARIGLMHMIGTNLSVWLNVLVQETKHEILTFYNPENNSLRISHRLGAKGGLHLGSYNHAHHGEHVRLPRGLKGPHHMFECRRTNIMGSLVQDASPFLFPCTIEYSLICAAILYVMWKNISKVSTSQPTTPPGGSRHHTHAYRRSPHHYSVDCARAHKGLFVGILILVLTIISLILFFVLISRPELVSLAVTEVNVCELTLYGMSTLATLIGMFQMRKLRYDGSRNLELDNILLVAAQTDLQKSSDLEDMQRCPYLHEMKERLLSQPTPTDSLDMERLDGGGTPVKEANLHNDYPAHINPGVIPEPPEMPPDPLIGIVVKLNSDGYGSHTSPAHARQPLVPQSTNNPSFCLTPSHLGPVTGLLPKNAKTSLFIIMSFIYAKLLVVVCIAYVISEVVTHKLPLYYYEGFFTYLYGVSILFLLYVFCFLLQESACCSRGSDSPPPPPRPPKPLNEPKEKSKKKDKRDKEQKMPKSKKEFQDAVDIEAGVATRALRKRKTSQNDHSHGSFFLRIGAIAFGLGTMVYNGLEFGAFFEVPPTSLCYQILRGVNPVLQMIFTFMQMYFIFMNSRLNIHRFKVIARFGLMHVVATNLCVWIRTLVLESLKEITQYHQRLGQEEAGVLESIKQHSLRNAGTILGTEPRDMAQLRESPSTWTTTTTVATTSVATLSRAIHTTARAVVGTFIKSSPTSTSPWTTTSTTTTPTITSTTSLPTTTATTAATTAKTTLSTLLSTLMPTTRTTATVITAAPSTITLSSATFAPSLLELFDAPQSDNKEVSQIFDVSNLTNASSAWIPNLGFYAEALTEDGTVSNSCGRVNIMGTIVQDAAPYLFPFIIEYSLIGAAVIYVMWKHIGRHSRWPHQAEADLERRLEAMLSRRAVALAHAGHARVDCVGASKGLFFGLLLLVGSLICLILFFVLIHHPELGLLAIYLADVSHCVLMALSIVAIVVGFIRVQSLKFKAEEQSDLNDILLRVSAFGVFVYAVFSVIAGSLAAFTHEPNLLVMVTGLLSVAQVVLQMLFIADVSRRRVHLPEHDRSKPGRQVVTFLLICNVTMWVIYTFETQKVVANPVQLDFYGFLSWAIVQRATLPLCIFHRFHSAVTLAEIWKTSYKARLE